MLESELERSNMAPSVSRPEVVSKLHGRNQNEAEFVLHRNDENPKSKLGKGLAIKKNKEK